MSPSGGEAVAQLSGLLWKRGSHCGESAGATRHPRAVLTQDSPRFSSLKHNSHQVSALVRLWLTPSRPRQKARTTAADSLSIDVSSCSCIGRTQILDRSQRSYRLLCLEAFPTSRHPGVSQPSLWTDRPSTILRPTHKPHPQPSSPPRMDPRLKGVTARRGDTPMTLPLALGYYVRARCQARF